MGARRPKPTALKERTKLRPQFGLSRLFAAANALVPFHQYEETEESSPDLNPDLVRDLKLVPDGDDKTFAIGDPRLKRPAKAELAQPNLFNTKLNLEPFPQFDPEAFKRAVDPVKDSVLPDEPKLKPLDEDSHYGTAVRVPNRKRNTPPPAETQTGQSIATRTSITKLKRAEKNRLSNLSAKAVALVFLVSAIGLGTYGLFATDAFSPAGPTARKSALTPEQIQERLNYYRTVTGGKLNRERIDVQIQNFQGAPSLDATEHKVKPPSILDGLPLKGETTAKTTKDLPDDPTFSEAKVAYGLQEEQERVDFEKRSREAWINEFVENARKDGINVSIDELGNVTAEPIKHGASGKPFFGQ
jgi:hypothetical protein